MNDRIRLLIASAKLTAEGQILDTQINAAMKGIKLSRGEAILALEHEAKYLASRPLKKLRQAV